MELLKRLKHETPKFWKKVRNIGLTLAALGTTVVAIPAIPAVIATYAAYAIAVGSTLASVASLTVTPDYYKEESNPIE